MLRLLIRALILVGYFGTISPIELLVSELCKNNNDQICSVSNLYAEDALTFKFDGNMKFNPENIIFKNCSLPTIPSVFNIFTKIKVFIMKKCGLKMVQQRDFEHARSVQLLVLKENSIEDLSDKVFFSLIKLEDIRLSHNFLFNLHPNTFFGLGKLRYLDLSYNKIREIPADLFSNLISMEYVDLQFNKIEKIDSTVFEHNSKLQTILLNNNRIIVFEGNSIKHLPRLHLMDVSHNVIDEIYIQSVNILKANNAGLKELRINGSVTSLSVNNNNLKRLFISQRNLITKLELHNNYMSSLSDLDGMRNLAELDLSHNPLESLDLTILAYLPNLLKLNLSATYLRNITEDTFLLQEKLTEIDLSHNRLLVLHPDVLIPMKSLQKLHLSGNSFFALNYEELKQNLPHLSTVSLDRGECHVNLNVYPINHAVCKHKLGKNITKPKAHNIPFDANVGRQYLHDDTTNSNSTFVLTLLTFFVVLALLGIKMVKYCHFLKNCDARLRSRTREANSTRLQEEL